jgi:hypothetical protein
MQLSPDEWTKYLDIRSGKSSKPLIKEAKQWLKKFPDAMGAPAVAGVLLTTVKSQRLLRLCKTYLDNADLNTFAPDVTDHRIGPFLMYGIVRHCPDSVMVDAIERYLERYPEHHIWHRVFATATFKNPEAKIIALTAKWIRLNRHNPKLFILLVPGLAPYPEVLFEVYRWLRCALGLNDTAPKVLSDVLCTIDPDSQMVPALTRMARRWVAENPTEPTTGRVYAELVLCTESRIDIQNASAWYRTHRHAESAWFVVATMLNLVKNSIIPPNSFWSKEAKRILRDNGSQNRLQRLVRLTFEVCHDDESAKWAREQLARQFQGRLFASLLHGIPTRTCLRRDGNGLRQQLTPTTSL